MSASMRVCMERAALVSLCSCEQTAPGNRSLQQLDSLCRRRPTPNSKLVAHLLSAHDISAIRAHMARPALPRRAQPSASPLSPPYEPALSPLPGQLKEAEALEQLRFATEPLVQSPVLPTPRQQEDELLPPRAGRYPDPARPQSEPARPPNQRQPEQPPPHRQQRRAAPRWQPPPVQARPTSWPQPFCLFVRGLPPSTDARSVADFFG